jgi:hypothetical protein
MNFDQYVPNPPKEELPIVKYAGRKGGISTTGGQAITLLLSTTIEI